MINHSLVVRNTLNQRSILKSGLEEIPLYTSHHTSPDLTFMDCHGFDLQYLWVAFKYCICQNTNH